MHFKIIGPHDQGISDSIKAHLQPQPLIVNSLISSPLCVDRTNDMRDQYFANLFSLNLSRCVVSFPRDQVLK